MKAVLVLAASLFSLSFATSVAQGNYFIQAGDEFTAGQQITSVPGVTLVMPTYEQKTDTEKETAAATATSNWADADFVASTGGNSNNPQLTEGVWHGTTYTFKVAKDGYIMAGVVLNANKTLVLLKNDTEDVLSTAKYILPSAAGGESQELNANNQVAAKAYGVVSFPVAAGNTYNIHCNGSKMGFFGFKFSETDPMAQEEASDFLPASELNFEGASVLSFSNMGLYGAAGTKANKIIGVEDTEAEDFTIQAANSSLLLDVAPNIQVNGASVKAIAVPAGEQVVISVPANKLATKLSIIAFANVYDSTATYRPTYFKEINGKEYTAETIDTLTSYRNFEHPDTFIVVCEELEQLTLTAEGEAVAFVAIVETKDNPYVIVDIEGTELLRNGDFETWKDNAAEWWASVKTTASNGATLTKTDDAYEGDAAIQIGNTTANKRLAYRELKLKKGTYYFSFMAKAVKGAKKMPSIQYGFVPSVDGKVGSYVYQDTKTIPSANKWTQYIDTLKFENDTVINLLVMSKKSTADVLVDAASLKTQDGALINYIEDFEYADNASFYVYEGDNDTIDFKVAPFGGVVAVASSDEKVATASINASSIIVAALAPGKAAITASLEGVTKTINYTVLEIGTGIETEQNVQGAKGVELVGKSYTVDAAYVLGEIENGYETFVTNGNADNTLTINVKEGARIKSIKIEAGANDEGLAESAEPISITAISIDGGDNILMPAESGAKPLTVVTKVIGIPAYPEMATILEAEDVLDNITFWFDNTNVKANKAVTFKYTIVYEIPEIELTVSADTIQVDETATISAKVTPASYVESRGYSVVYKLADGTAATIDGNVITGVDAGVASVVAYLINGTDTAATATAEVAVVAKPLPPTPGPEPEPEIGINKETTTGAIFEEDFEDETDASKMTGSVKLTTGDAVFGNYAEGSGSGSGNRGAQLNFYTSTENRIYYDSLTAYTIDFDYAIAGGNVANRSVAQVAVIAENGQNSSSNNTQTTNVLFEMHNLANSNASEWNTLTINGDAEKTIQADKNTWYHVYIKVDPAKATASYTISQLDGTEVVSGVYNIPEGTSTYAKAIFLLGPRGTFTTKLDNVVVNGKKKLILQSVYAEDYESRDNASDWIPTNNASISYITDGDNHYAKAVYSGSGNRGARKVFFTTGATDLTDLDAYFFDVDFQLGSGPTANRSQSGFTVFTDGALMPNNASFASRNTGAKNYLFDIYNVTNADADAMSTMTVNGSEQTFKVTDQTWYHLSLYVNKADSMITYIVTTKADGVEVVKGKYKLPADGTSINIQGLYVLAARNNGNGVWVDNIALTTESKVMAPELTFEGNEGTSKLITLTQKEANAIYYRINSGDDQTYTAPFRIYETDTITTWCTKGKLSSMEMATIVEAGLVPAPTATITKVDGVERYITLADDSTKATFTYSVDGTTFVDYAAPFVISANTNLSVLAKMKDVYTDEYFVSDTATFEFTAGEWIKLDTVLFSRVYFEKKEGATAADTAMAEDYEAKELSAWKVYLNPDQTLCNPEKKIHLIYVTSDHKDTTDLGTYNTGDTVYHIPYGGVFATAHADGYADSYGHVFFRPAPKLDTVMWIDIDTIANRQHEGGWAVELLGTDHFTANGVEMAPIAMKDSVLDARFGVQTGTNWLSRDETKGSGLYQYNGGYRSIGISGVQAHQLVVLEYTLSIQSTSSNLEENSAMSNGNVHVYTCTEAGNVQFSLERYGYVKRVGVLNSSDVVMNPVFSIDRVDGNEYFVKIESSGSEDCPSYDYFYSYVTSDSLNENYTLANQYYDTLGFTTSVATEIVDYNTGEHTPLTYDTTWVTNLVKEYWTPYYKYEEPIGITDTTVFRAYAWYQDLKSDVVIDTIAAGTPVQLARPVITYVGSTDTTDLYQITVDNSGVISQPKCSVRVGWSVPSQEIANGDTIAVDKDIYGWFYARAFADGYNWSERAFRYVDARESHNETYTALYNTSSASDTIMPASTADFEISPDARFTSTTLRASGNVYYHRWMEAGFNTIALPFVPAYVTDAKGNKLTEGEDYKIYNFTSKGNGNATSDASLETSVIGIDLENYRRTAKMNAYTGAYLYYTEQAGEVIFVSSNGVQFRANNTMTMAARNEGWQVAINNTFKDQESTAAFYEVVANPAGMAGSALVRRDSGTVIAPFTAVLLVDTAFMNANDTIQLEYAHKGAAIEIHSATLANGSVEVKFSAMPVTYNIVTDEYEVVEGLNLTYNVEMFIVTEEGVESLGTATAKNVEGANYTATIKGGEAGQTVMIVVTTSIQGSDVLVTVLGEGDSTNGIESLTADDKFADGPIYNINGMRVEKVQKGQNYIMNGKKFQVR